MLRQKVMVQGHLSDTRVQLDALDQGLAGGRRGGGGWGRAGQRAGIRMTFMKMHTSRNTITVNRHRHRHPPAAM